jgi:hypothetical protein
MKVSTCDNVLWHLVLILDSDEGKGRPTDVGEEIPGF